MIEAMITPPENIKDWSDPVFRILTSLIFIVGGLGHFAQHQIMLDRMEGSPWWGAINMIGDPSWLLWVSGGVFIGSGIMLALGWMTRLSALLIFLTLVPITVTVHIAPGHVGPLLKNVAILGSLFLIYCRGPGKFAIDNRAIPMEQRHD
jgi:putative oxidoreductase